MAVTNISYITDLDELFLYVSKKRVLELAYIDFDTQDPYQTPIIAAVQDILFTQMNAARKEIDSYLRKVYTLSKARGLVDTVSASSPSAVIKRLCADYTLFLLERQRMGVLERNDAENSFRRRFVNLQKSDAEQILEEDTERLDQVLPRDRRPDVEQGTPFDRVPGYWSAGTTRGDPPVD